MTLAIIKLDGARVGLADTDPQGVGLIQWFHQNAGGQSMSYYLEHGGYSVEEVETIDCHDVEALIGAICARAGVTMESVFVPFSQSRNAKPSKDGKVWRSLNWRVTIKRHGRTVLESDYAQGEGHAPAYKAARNPSRMTVDERAALDRELEEGRTASPRHAFRKPIPAPSIGDVMQSLIMDASALDAADFEEWARDLGYDTDSREAESIYRACVEIATKLRAGLGGHLFAEIRLAASFN